MGVESDLAKCPTPKAPRVHQGSCDRFRVSPLHFFTTHELSPFRRSGALGRACRARSAFRANEMTSSENRALDETASSSAVLASIRTPSPSFRSLTAEFSSNRNPFRGAARRTFRRTDGCWKSIDRSRQVSWLPKTGKRPPISRQSPSPDVRDLAVRFVLHASTRPDRFA